MRRVIGLFGVLLAVVALSGVLASGVAGARPAPRMITTYALSYNSPAAELNAWAEVTASCDEDDVILSAWEDIVSGQTPVPTLVGYPIGGIWAGDHYLHPTGWIAKAFNLYSTPLVIRVQVICGDMTP